MSDSNKFQVKEGAPEGLLKVDPTVGKMQAKKLAELRGKRDNGKVKASLAELKAAAEGTDNLMPRILEAVRNYATLGEDLRRASRGLRRISAEGRPLTGGTHG